MDNTYFRPYFAWVAAVSLLFAAAMPAQAKQLPDFTQLIKQNRAAVINISTTQNVTQRAVPFPNFPGNDPFNEFFKHFFDQIPNQPRNYKVQSLGSGFIISPDGYILTNAHVVHNADRVIASLGNHRSLPAKVVGADNRYDIALIKIKAKNLPTVKIGDSDKLEVGQWVVAIGAPFGLSHTATAGIVSALGRNLPGDAYVPFIQTDVPINPGNSGGPLFDMDGRVVGINSQIYSNTGGYMGLSFSIPINVAMKIADQLKTKGYASHGYLGVMIQSVTEDLAKSFGLSQSKGALISQVTPKSPAEKAGLKAGDIILAYDGKPVVESDDLPPLVGATPAGKTVPIKILHDGKEQIINVTIGELPKQPQRAQTTPQKESRLNMAVADLTPQQKQQLGTGKRGVLVQEVGQGAAADAGIQPGDVILAVNRKPVSTVEQLAQLVRSLPKGETVPVLVMRNGNTLFLALTLG